MKKLKRRDFLKMVGIAVTMPTALLKAKSFDIGIVANDSKVSDILFDAVKRGKTTFGDISLRFNNNAGFCRLCESRCLVVKASDIRSDCILYCSKESN